MVMLTAGLQTVPEGLLRAARVDGASTWNQFRHVTLPHLRGVILITTLLLVVINLNSFTLVWLMTGGGPANASQLWITEIYQHRLPHIAIRPSLGVFGDSLHYHARPRLLLREGTHRQHATAGGLTPWQPPAAGFRCWVWCAGSFWPSCWPLPPCRWSGCSRPRSRPSSPPSSNRRSGSRPNRRFKQYTTLLSPANRHRAAVPGLSAQQSLGFFRHDGSRRAGRRSGGLRLFPLQFPRQEPALFLGAAAQHVPGVVFLIPLFILMRFSVWSNTLLLADHDLSHLRAAAFDLVAERLLRQHPCPSSNGRRASTARLASRHSCVIVMPLSAPGHRGDRDLLLHPSPGTNIVYALHLHQRARRS